MNSESTAKPNQSTEEAPDFERDASLHPTGVNAPQPAGMLTENASQSIAEAFEFNVDVPNPPETISIQQEAVQQVESKEVLDIQGKEPLTESMLAGASAEDQKQMIRERLFPFIKAWYPNLAEMITGMLLELDNSVLLHMLEDENHISLKSKVEEVVVVLEAYYGNRLSKAQPSDMPSSNVFLPKAAVSNFTVNTQIPLQNIEFQEPLTFSMIADFSEEQQKELIVDRLFLTIYSWYPHLAEQITRMFLDLDNWELWLMLDDIEFLKSMVEMAVDVLADFFASSNWLFMEP